MRLSRWLTVLVAASLLASGAAAQEAGDVTAGHAFALKICAVCHAVQAGDASSPNPLAPTFRRIAAEPGMTGTALSVILHNPHREMPDLILQPDDRSNVIAYILTLKPKD